MLQRLEDGPSETSVRFRKRVGMILCFGASAYLLAVSLGLLRHAGSLADNARQYAQAPVCAQNVSVVNCREIVPASVSGTRIVSGVTFYHLQPRGHRAVDFHAPGNLTLFRDLQAHRSVMVEYWRGQVTALRDSHGNVERAFGAPSSSSQNDAVGSSGVLFFALVLLAVGVAVMRLPVDLAAGGGPPRYSLPYTIRPPQRWLYAVFAAPSLAWFGPAMIDAKSQPSLTASHLAGELLSGFAFAIFIAALLVLFAAWYLENRIDLTHDGIQYRTLFTRRSVRFDEVESWQIRLRRRSQKIQYVDIYGRGARKPIRLQMDMHWRRSKEIVQDVLRRRVPQGNARGASTAGG